jgi:hypothetical protein
MWWLMEKYDETLAVINKMAMVKMHMNAHKGAIENVSAGNLMQLMQKEIDELDQAVVDQDIMHIIEEAADVMYFLVALTYQQINEYRSRKSSSSSIDDKLHDRSTQL